MNLPNTILQTSWEDQAADHLIKGVCGNYRCELAENWTFQEGSWTGQFPADKGKRI
jgi:hypothetical protein